VAAVELPTGTVTFLFTDLETSTRNWEEQPEGVMRDALTRHDEILRDAVESHRGVVFSTMGDGVAAAFASAPDAVAAALDAQHGLSDDEWGRQGLLRARMGLYTDEGRLRAPDQYENRPLNRCARLMSTAHGGQILISDATEALVRRSLPSDASLTDLGTHRLRDVAEPIRVFQVVDPSLESDFPPLRSLNDIPGNLPRQVTSFVGREREIEDLSALVRDRQLVTLTGVGGVGKTRLALEVAANVVLDFHDGTWLCELAPVTDPDAVWDALATSLGVQRNPGRALDVVVLDYLQPKRLLTVLDNCEHLLDSVALVVDAITRRSPEVAILATSREGLAVPGEQLVAVPALGVPRGDDADPAESDAVRLFVDRARDVKPDFALAADNADAVAQLCRRLDGIPLAIELAAARVRTLTPDDLVARLDQRFRLLTRGSRAALERHQTLRNTVDWSYNLLSADEQVALNRLSVFAGGCDLEAAESILAPDDEFDAIDVLSQLVDKSLAIADDDTGGRRYRLLETIRQYAAERLEASGDTARTRRTHAEYFIALSERAGPRLRDRHQLEWAAKLTRDVENLRAALDWAVEEQSADHALRLVAPLMVTAIPVGWTMTNWADTAGRVPGAQTHQLYPVVVAFASLGAVMRSSLDRAAALVAEALDAQERLGTNHLWVLTAAGVLAYARGDLDTTLHYAEQWLAGARERNDPYEIAHALILLAPALAAEPQRAIATADEAVQLSRDNGIASALLYALIVRATLPADGATALALLDEATDVARHLGDRHGVATAEAFRGMIASREGKWSLGLRSVVNAVAAQFINDPTMIMPPPLFGISFALCRVGDLAGSAIALGFVQQHYVGMALDAEGTALLAESEALLTEGLGAGEFERLKAQGAALNLRQMIAYAQEAVAALPDAPMS
jgi:predicted ATPase/class 3 adenylate cyclase